jgi:GDP-4-dehydro-6-deoxy-D-mannose reductase
LTSVISERIASNGEVLRVLITGGTGFVGAHLIKFLKSRASHIAVLAFGASSSSEPGVQYYAVDIRNADGVRSVVHDFSPQQIYHLAGISAVDLSWSDPRLSYEVNVFGAHNLFDAAMSLPSPPKILNISTSQVYAASSEILTEESSVGPDNPYAASKAMAELLLVQYRKAVVGGIITARSFNHTGAGQPPNFALPSIAKQFAEIECSLRPSKLTLGNIDVKRDFSDVRDVVRAYWMLLQSGRTGEVYNVCSGCAVSLAHIIKRFETISGINVSIEIDSDRVRSNEVMRICGDPRKIQTEIGWYRQVPLEKTIEDLLQYWRLKCRSQDVEKVD